MSSRIIGLPSSSVSVIALNDELSLFEETRGLALTLNRTASDVWALADGRASVDSVIACLAAAYGTTPAVIRDDVITAVDELEAAEVLLPASG